jgi:flavin reductase (DIM6/NTAB) family NADH-FMN oxidoreductase RutF/plasmid maintenance system antidote protein VapI
VGRRRTRPSNSDFGLFLDQQLAQRGLTATCFAERAGLSASHVYQLLRGDRLDPRGTTLRKVARALGMAESELTTTVAGRENGSETRPATPVDKATFFALMSAFPTGVTIVATLDEDGQPRGLTCTAVCSLSADPPLLLVCIDRRSRTLPALRYSGRFVVNYLLAGRGELSNRFAGHQPDRWLDTAWRPTRTGLPWLHADSLAYAECSLVQEIPSGDHVICVGRVDGGQPPAPGTQPLMYFRRGYATVPD